LVSLALLVKSADWFIESAEKIGLALKISPFIIGVTIVAMGTSLPELMSSLVAVFKGATEIVVANAIGSNIANIFLIVGISSIIAKSLIVRRNLIDLDAPLLIAFTSLFIFSAWDRVIVLGEGILLIIGFIIYLLYTAFQGRDSDLKSEIVEILPLRADRREKKVKQGGLSLAVFFYLFLGGIGLAVGANYTIEAVLKLSALFNVATSFIAITAVAIGTSLPELIVSAKAAFNKKYEIALGNIFGSNIFNILLVVGIPALIKPIAIDDLTFAIGLPFLVVSTLLFAISSISQKIHIWEGLAYLLIYVFFVIKLAGIF